MSRVSEPAGVLASLRAEARAIASAGVAAVDAGRRLRPALDAWLAARPGRGGVRAVAAGKAAGVMMRTALDAGLMVERGLIASTHWQGAPTPCSSRPSTGSPPTTRWTTASACRGATAGSAT